MNGGLLFELGVEGGLGIVSDDDVTCVRFVAGETKDQIVLARSERQRALAFDPIVSRR